MLENFSSQCGQRFRFQQSLWFSRSKSRDYAVFFALSIPRLLSMALSLPNISTPMKTAMCK